MNPTIYVIVPVYNCEKYVSQALHSILSQPYENIQIVVVNDGSTDNSLAVIQNDFSSNNKVTLITQKNSGVSAARNAGIEYVLSVSGNNNDYISFCDADDCWTSNCISQSLIEKYSKHELLCFRAVYASSDLSSVSQTFPNISTCKIINHHNKNIWDAPWFSVMLFYKLKLFTNIDFLFSRHLKYNEDKVFVMQLFYYSDNICFLPYTLYIYRKNAASALSTRPHGIEYYVPLINGWLNADIVMSKYRSEERGIFSVGNILASIYMLDMAKEHYWYGGKHKLLENTMKEHPHYKEFLALNAYDVSKKQYKDFSQLNNHPFLFAVKHRIIGLFVRAYHKISKTAFARKILNKIQFKYDNIYI